MTADYDIGFGVYHKPVEMKNKKVHAGDMTEVVSECTVQKLSRVYVCLDIKSTG